MNQGKGSNSPCLILFSESEVGNACYWQTRGGRDRDCFWLAQVQGLHKCDEAGFWELEGREHRLKSTVGGLKAQALGTNFMEHAALVEVTQSHGHARVTLPRMDLRRRGRHNFRIPPKLAMHCFSSVTERDA